VQSAIRKGFKIKKKYFLNKSVVVNPLELNISNLNDIRNKSRKKLNIAYDEVVFGKIARPDFVKWNLLPIDAFNIAVKHNKKLKLLLQEPPTEVIAYIEKLKINDNVIVLPTTTSFDELLSSYAAIDVILHITDFGESFGYGIAEPMALSKPIITNSIPWGDQAQVELVKHGINGFIANSAYTISKTILWFAENKKMIPIMGAKSKLFIDSYSSYSKSIERLESIMKSLLKNRMNPFFVTDFHDAKIAEINLQRYNYGVFFIDKFVTFFKNLYINLKMIFFKLYNSINR
jgi:glycosyltransferase involved in cell wall biosynthesis